MSGIKGKSGVYVRTKPHWNKGKKYIKKCKNCGNRFRTFHSEERKGGGKYCSPECYRVSSIGRVCGYKFGERKSNPQWKNGRNITNKGYVNILKPQHPFCSCRGYIPEHRLVVEKQIGRYLLPKETVHHLGEKGDNRPAMLMAFINHSTHIRFERTGIVKSGEIIFDGRLLKNA